MAGCWSRPGPTSRSSTSALEQGTPPVRVLVVQPRGTLPRNGEGLRILQEDGLVSQRFDARPGTTYLLRPDQHVCARWRGFDATKLRGALARATGRP